MASDRETRRCRNSVWKEPSVTLRGATLVLSECLCLYHFQVVLFDRCVSRRLCSLPAVPRSVGSLPIASDGETRCCRDSIDEGSSMTLSWCDDTSAFWVLMFVLLSVSFSTRISLACLCCLVPQDCGAGLSQEWDGTSVRADRVSRPCNHHGKIRITFIKVLLSHPLCCQMRLMVWQTSVMLRRVVAMGAVVVIDATVDVVKWLLPWP